MINDPGNAGTASTPPRTNGGKLTITRTDAAADAARKRQANATALGMLTGGAVLFGGLGGLLLTSWLPLAVAGIAWAGLAVIATAVNNARFPGALGDRT